MSDDNAVVTPNRASTGPDEPILAMDDIQGIAVPGFLKPAQTLVGIRFQGEIRDFKKLLKEMAGNGEIATAEKTLQDRRAHRTSRAMTGLAHPEMTAEAPAEALIGVGFTQVGLRQLSSGADAIPGEAFQKGLPARSALLGDPTAKEAEGNPAQWVVGKPGEELHALFVVAGNTRAAVNACAGGLVARLADAGVEITYQEHGDIRPDLPGHEHFGFDDGVSQPGIRGRASEAQGDFITERYLEPDATPEAWLFGRPGQDLLWPGEFVLGYPKTGADPLLPGRVDSLTPEWTRNGSFLVFRRLRQDVGLFWRTMRDQAHRLESVSGFTGIDDVTLAARLVGRWPSGAPVNRTPAADDPALGKDDNANNHFRFDSPSAALPIRNEYTDPFPMAGPDPAGIACPWAAHIRKVNTRDSGSDMGGRESTYGRRVLRIGIPYGQPLKDRYAEKSEDPQAGNRGLLFLSIQASIEDQFEFLQARWMNDPSRPKMPGGHDMLVGQNGTPGEERVRRCTLFGEGLQQAAVDTAAQWIIPTGGGYFFLPSIRALQEVLGV